MKIPASIVKGDSVAWKDCATYDNLNNPITPDAWTLKYAIRGTSSLDLTATQDGNQWSTTVSKVQSGALSAGEYSWQAYVTDIATGLSRITIGEGKLQITDDISSASPGYDGRSQIQIDLENVQAAIRAMISGGAVQSYMIGGRSVQRMQLNDLIELESKLKYRLALEQKADKIKNGLGNPHNLFVRFK